MNTYLIKIDNKYLVGTNEEDFGKVPAGGMTLAEVLEGESNA